MVSLKQQGKRVGIIYMIRNTENNDKYIGSTFKSLEERFEDHKWHCNTANSKLYKVMREIGKDKFFIEQLEIVEVSNRREMTEIEDKYIADLGTLNQKFNNSKHHKLALPAIKPETETEEILQTIKPETETEEILQTIKPETETEETIPTSESEDIERKEDPFYDDAYSDFDEDDIIKYDGNTDEIQPDEELYLEENENLLEEISKLRKQILDYDIKINTFLSFKTFDNNDIWKKMRVKIINSLNNGTTVKDRVIDKYLIRWNSQLKHYY